MISTLELRLLPCMAADSCAKNAELHHGLLDDVPMTLAPSIVIKEDGRSEIYVHSHFSSVVIDVRWRSMFDRNLYIECKENDTRRNFGPFGIHPDRAARAIELLETKSLTSEAKTEIQHLAASLKDELQAEYKRMSPERVQRSLTMLEISVYSPTIEEAWADTGISRLRIDTEPNHRWYEVLEAVCYKAAKYID